MGAVVTLLSPDQQRQQALWRRVSSARAAFTINPTQATAKAAVDALRGFVEVFVDDPAVAAILCERFEAYMAGFREGSAA